MPAIRVLTIEDEIVIAMLLKMMLTEQGFAVLGNATNGQEGIRLAQEGKPDLVLADIIIAGKMNGIETAQAILRQHDCKIVYITANVNEQTEETIRETKPFGLYLKPITKSVIAEIHRKIIAAG